jgi:hypothetical protein
LKRIIAFWCRFAPQIPAELKIFEQPLIVDAERAVATEK